MRTAFIIEVNGKPIDARIEAPAFLDLADRAKALAVVAADREAECGARVSVYRVNRRWQSRQWVDGMRELVYTASAGVAP
jgi:hypothetical protein